MDILIKNKSGETVTIEASAFKHYCEEKGWHYESAMQAINRPSITYRLHTLSVLEPEVEPEKPSKPAKPRKTKTPKV